MQRFHARVFFALLLGLIAQPLLAAGGGSKMPEGVNYISLGAPLIVNYGGPGGKPRYIKAELAIRTENASDSQAVMHHLPLIRDRLIGILSSQTEDSLGSVEGRETLRQEALADINRAVHAMEYGSPMEHGQSTGHPAAPGNKPASDLLFNNFVVQR